MNQTTPVLETIKPRASWVGTPGLGLSAFGGAMRTCTICGEPKPGSGFYLERNGQARHRSRCKACLKAQVKRHYRANSTRIIQRNRERMEANREQFEAVWAFNNAIQRGNIVRPCACSRCGGEGNGRKIEGHHPDYSKPFDVNWLCRPCHLKMHGEAKRKK